MSEEVCAFANASGGVILIGINDNNELKGVTIDNAKRSAIQNSINEITPHLPCSITTTNIGDKSGDKSGDKETDNTRNRIIRIIKSKATITIPQIAELLNMSPKGVEYHFAEMKKEGLLIREGSRKAGMWKINKK